MGDNLDPYRLSVMTSTQLMYTKVSQAAPEPSQIYIYPDLDPDLSKYAGIYISLVRNDLHHPIPPDGQVGLPQHHRIGGTR